MKMTAYMEIDHVSQLPLEIQLLILQKLNYVEFSRFNAVCKDWRSIASAARQQSPSLFRLQQVPWLIHTVSSRRRLPKLSYHENILFKFELFLYSSFTSLPSQGFLLSHQRILELFDLHEFNSICGASQRWLLVTQSAPASDTFLQNPRTGQRISLPKAAFGSFLLNPLTRHRISLPENPKTNYLKAGVILPHHSSDAAITVVACFDNDRLYYCSSQDEHWTEIGGSSPMIPADMIYHKGNIYVVDKYNYTSVSIINISSNRPYCCVTALAAPLVGYRLGPNFVHLVECDGNLLMVVIGTSTVPDVSVFKYISNPMGFEKFTSIGGKYALLVSEGNSMAIDVSTNSTSFRANCVYFFGYESHRKGIRCFDLGKNTFGTFVPYRWKGEVTTPTWFMPSLT